ncbi:hypothetical protein QQF64_005490 [Cirrhinus molitorella]|uniref:Uncharacterized protein n=1 Tax=Cirrhinus molitorella TaxID=172907 RepID=A0ABR3MEM9_9TELE
MGVLPCYRETGCDYRSSMMHQNSRVQERGRPASPFHIILGQSLRFQTKPNIPFLNVTSDLTLKTLVFGAAVAEPRWLCPLGVILVWRMSRPVSLLIGQFLHPLAVGCGQNVS